MRTAKVTYRPAALADLQAIYDLIADLSQSHEVAGRFVARIMNRCRSIGDAPLGGRPRDDLMPGLRTVPFEKTAVVVYRVTDTVEIVNVFYGGRDYDAFYRGEVGPED